MFQNLRQVSKQQEGNGSRSECRRAAGTAGRQEDMLRRGAERGHQSRMSRQLRESNKSWTWGWGGGRRGGEEREVRFLSSMNPCGPPSYFT